MTYISYVLTDLVENCSEPFTVHWIVLCWCTELQSSAMSTSSRASYFKEFPKKHTPACFKNVKNLIIQPHILGENNSHIYHSCRGTTG